MKAHKTIPFFNLHKLPTLFPILFGTTLWANPSLYRLSGDIPINPNHTLNRESDGLTLRTLSNLF